MVILTYSYFQVINYGTDVDPMDVKHCDACLSHMDNNNNDESNCITAEVTRIRRRQGDPQVGVDFSHRMGLQVPSQSIKRSVFDVRPASQRPVRVQSGDVEKQELKYEPIVENDTTECHTLPIYNKLQLADAIKFGRLYATRRKARIIQKDGSLNIIYSNIGKKRRSYFMDIFTTMLELRWRYTLLVFALGFLLTWSFYAGVWCLVAYFHGDFDMDKDDSERCMSGVYDFWTALYFSVETQHTIGYGTRAANVLCRYTSIILMSQSIIGVMVQSILAGVVFAKLSRPKYRSQTIMFSKNAAICIEDGQYYLMFRVGDMRKSLLIGATMQASIVYKRITEEGQEIPFHPRSLEIHVESAEHDQYFALSWPIRVVHRIDETSPFWTLNYGQILTEEFEILIFLEGTMESSSQTTQIRTSYLPSEIRWGYSLAPLVTSKNSLGQFCIDFSRFNQMEAMPCMPSVSAEEYKQQGEKARQKLTNIN